MRASRAFRLGKTGPELGNSELEASVPCRFRALDLLDVDRIGVLC